MCSRANLAARICAFDAALSEAAGHQHGVVLGELRNVLFVEGFGVDVFDLHPRVIVDAGMPQRFVERLVGVRKVGVLAAHGDRDFARRVLHLMHQTVPAAQVGGFGQQLQLHAGSARPETLLVQHARHLVDGVHVPHRDHAVRQHVGEQRDLLALFVGNGAVGAAQQHVGLDPGFAQLSRTVCWVGLRLQLAGCGDPRHVGQVWTKAVLLGPIFRLVRGRTASGKGSGSGCRRPCRRSRRWPHRPARPRRRA